MSDLESQLQAAAQKLTDDAKARVEAQIQELETIVASLPEEKRAKYQELIKAEKAKLQ